MNRQQVNSIGDEIMRVLEAAKAEGKLQGYDINRAGGTFGAGGYTMKLSVTPQLDEAETARIASQTTEQVVGMGLARAGTPVLCRIKGGADQRGTIVKANRSRYVIKGIGGKYDGVEFTYPFAATRLAAPETANA